MTSLHCTPKIHRYCPDPLQAAFVDYGGNRHGFLAFSEVHPDYYQIPVEDRQKLLEEEAAYDRELAEEEEKKAEEKPKGRGRGRRRSSKAASEGAASSADEVVEAEAEEAPEEEVKKPRGRGRGRRKKTEETSDDADASDAEDKDANIESVAAEDVQEEIRPRRKRMRRYNIQEVIKVRQILLVQVVKEERGNKGAALTTYLSLAGRYCVLMPNTARGGGISRKITNPADRKKLKAMAQDMEVPTGAGLIVRTAGAKRTKTEIKRDYEYLLRQWEQIRDNTLPAST